MITKHADGAGALFSDCERYRYRLWRVWDVSLPRMAVVMLNPSTADELTVDPTVTRCIGFARREGFGGLEVVNLYAWRSTQPAELLVVDDPVGPENDFTIVEVCSRGNVGRVVAAWGTGRMVGRRAPAVEALLATSGVAVFRIGEPTQDGHPRHPLYLKADAPIVPHVRVEDSMVSNAEGRTTLTTAEAAVINMLRENGPADLGPRTEAILVRGRPLFRVDIKAAKRLAKAGLVVIDAGGQASLPPT